MYMLHVFGVRCCGRVKGDPCKDTIMLHFAAAHTYTILVIVKLWFLCGWAGMTVLNCRWCTTVLSLPSLSSSADTIHTPQSTQTATHHIAFVHNKFHHFVHLSERRNLREVQWLRCSGRGARRRQCLFC